jgi:hypothetical protein
MNCGGRECLLKGKVDKDPPGFHGLYIAGPGTVGVLVAKQFIGQGKHPANGRGKFKVFEVKINPKAYFIVENLAFHPKGAAAVIVRGILIAPQVQGCPDPPDDKGFKIPKPAGARFEEERKTDIGRLDFTDVFTLWCAYRKRKAQISLGVKKPGFKTQVEEFIQAHFPDEPYIKTHGFTDLYVCDLLPKVVYFGINVFKFKIVLVESEKIPPVKSCQVLILEIENGLFIKLSANRMAQCQGY